MTMGYLQLVGYLPESMHGAGSPQAQRIMIARQSNLEMKKELAKKDCSHQVISEQTIGTHGAPRECLCLRYYSIVSYGKYS